ncbi:hypothetical protein J1614_004312, partial [Plenodomus biglobosus]
YPGQVPNTEFRLVQCEATANLFELFCPRYTTSIDELALLKQLTDLWAQANKSSARNCSLTTKPLTQADPGSFTEEIFVDCLLIINEIRAVRLHFKNFSQFEGRNSTDLLCMAFGVLTNTTGVCNWSELLSSLDKNTSKIIVHTKDLCNNVESHISVNRNETLPIPGSYEPAGSSGTVNKPTQANPMDTWGVGPIGSRSYLPTSTRPSRTGSSQGR